MVLCGRLVLNWRLDWMVGLVGELVGYEGACGHLADQLAEV